MNTTVTEQDIKTLLDLIDFIEAVPMPATAAVLTKAYYGLLHLQRLATLTANAPAVSATLAHPN